MVKWILEYPDFVVILVGLWGLATLLLLGRINHYAALLVSGVADLRRTSNKMAGGE